MSMLEDPQVTNLFKMTSSTGEASIQKKTIAYRMYTYIIKKLSEVKGDNVNGAAKSRMSGEVWEGDIQFMAEEVTNYSGYGDPFLLDLYMNRLSNIILILAIHINLSQEKGKDRLVMGSIPFLVPIKEIGGWHYDIISYNDLIAGREDGSKFQNGIWGTAINTFLSKY